MPSILDVRRGFTAMYNLFNVMVEQACSSEGRIVDRARMWCSTLNVPFFRFNPQLSQEIALDEHDDECLVRMMWETRAYMKAQAKSLALLKPLLVGPEDPPPIPPRQNTPCLSPSKLRPRISISSSTSQDVPDTPHSLLSGGTSPDEDGSYHSTNPELNIPSAENTCIEELLPQQQQQLCTADNHSSGEGSSSPEEGLCNHEDSESSDKISIASAHTVD